MQLLTFIALTKNSESSRELREAFDGNPHARLLAVCENAEQMLADVIRMKPSAAVVVLEAESSEREFALIKKLVAASPGTTIITAARDASPRLILGSMRSGAREFFQLPIIADEFKAVLDSTAEFSAAHEDKAKGSRVVAVFSGKGGTGVSFFTTNLAAAMNVPTLLVDLDLQAGDAASFLGLSVKYSVSDFVSNRVRLDDSLINTFITPHSANLALLAAPLETHEAEDIKSEDMTEILHLLGQRYECIVLDLPHTFDPVTISALDFADDILLLLTLDIPGIRSTKRALKVFERLGYPRTKIHVVVNRWSKNTDVELQKVQAHLGEQFIGLVPNDYRKVMESINLGQPLVQTDHSSKLTVEIKRIAALVANGNHTAPPPARKRLLGAMFGRQDTATLELSVMPDTA
ncbi:MAG TPA: AAA family ATPase [Pyrinomonadaceae bacterium]|jgi:pilus assembly protein CpaE